MRGTGEEKCEQSFSKIRLQCKAITIYHIPCIFLSKEFYRAVWLKCTKFYSWFCSLLEAFCLCICLFTNEFFPRGIKEKENLSLEGPFQIFASFCKILSSFEPFHSVRFNYTLGCFFPGPSLVLLIVQKPQVEILLGPEIYDIQIKFWKTLCS